jgi:nucleotide-binding universal stress UspA family protein
MLDLAAIVGEIGFIGLTPPDWREANTMSQPHPVGANDGPAGRVVVGVDGSESSIRALQWAERQAKWIGATLEVVTAWTFPERPAPLGIVPHVPWPDELMAEAREKLDEVIEDVLSDTSKERVHAQIIRGSAAAVLLDVAHDADLLVVGSRGLGAFKDLLLGSVSEHCVRHANCPVVVVR